MLVNADTNQDIQPLYDGAVINLDTIGTRNLTVRAETTGSVESVKFDLNGGSYTKIENTLPYAIAGDTNGDYAAYPFATGVQTLKVTAYPYDNAAGTQGANLDLQFVFASAGRCELESTVRSQVSQIPMHFKVDNNTNAPLELFWINFAGQRQSYGTVKPGKKWSTTTYVTHPWVIARDADNLCVQLIPDPGSEAKVVINDLFKGTYKLTAVHSNKALGVAGGSTTDGGSVQQWTYGGGAHQKWRVEPVGDDIYRLVSVNSNKCLDISGGSTADGGNAIQWSCHGGNNQQWRIEPDDGGAFKLISVNSNKCLDVNGATMDDGGNVIQWTCSSANNQKWLITPVN